MNIAWSKLLPVIVSILIIIAVAILRHYSRAFAAIAATMPINLPLGMWIVFSGTTEGQDQTKLLAEFAEAAFYNMFPTVLFIFVAWQMTKAGHSLIAAILVGYVAWAVTLGGVYLLRAVLR
ncbi:MAG TPA: hypothetical protein PLD47_02680 [Aggregatilineales bacterium]|nr:hypothetical protein [Anaerolineales bacterium]HRE46606.1 hypothetical protein [Aggregatilineales bacterium]